MIINKIQELYTFVSNKSFVQLLKTSPKNLILLENFNSEFLLIEVGLLIKIPDHYRCKIKQTLLYLSIKV